MAFLANPHSSSKSNLVSFLKQLSIDDFLSIPTNLSCHNLLFAVPPPPGIKSLLGLGSNFCLQSRSSANSIQHTIDRYTNDVRRTYFWQRNKTTILKDQQNETYNPKLYFKSNWKFSKASKQIEHSLHNLAEDLHRLSAKYNSVRRSPNLTPRKYILLSSLKHHDLYIMVESDKNLGLCILEQDYYIKR